jgi:hypothetical protein
MLPIPEVLMRLLCLGLLMLSCSSASAFPVQVQQEPKIGTGCTGEVVALYPKLRTCPISGDKKSRVWCPNGDVFDLDDAKASKPLARSLCGLRQIAD